MPEKTVTKVRGVYEHPKGSAIWWCQYFEGGKRHRERVGTQANAIKLYQKRKTQILLGEKLPELSRRKVTVSELIDDALAYARDHDRVMRNYEGNADRLRLQLGVRPAEDVKPEEIAAWIRRHAKSPANFNRYRSFVSLCFREGIRNGKVRDNPARHVLQRSEPRGRQRFLSRDEYDKVLAKLRQLYPEQAPAFIISVHTGMRLSEQYGMRWSEVDFDRGELRLRRTKNGDDRTIPMSNIVQEQFRNLRPKVKYSASSLVFPRKNGGKGRIKAPSGLAEVLLMEDVAIADYTWHNNRHTFCSWLAIAGSSLRTIQELAGHRTVEMSARYAHLSPDHKRSEIERMSIRPKGKLTEFASATRTAIGE